jgi:hypothetical protein
VLKVEFFVGVLCCCVVLMCVFGVEMHLMLCEKCHGYTLQVPPHKPLLLSFFRSLTDDDDRKSARRVDVRRAALTRRDSPPTTSSLGNV